MSVLWRKIEFHKEESDCEAIFIAAGESAGEVDEESAVSLP